MKNNCKKLIISSLQTNISQVERFVEEICDESHISASYFANIMLAMEEAVKNAIVHGNKQEQQKKVVISFQRIKSGLTFIIEDEGDGFNYRDIPSPIDTEEVSGSGIFLMRSLADKVSFNEKGNQVELVFSTTSISQETTLNRICQVRKYFNKQKTFANN